jgi:hypothetical protein
MARYAEMYRTRLVLIGLAIATLAGCPGSDDDADNLIRIDGGGMLGSGGSSSGAHDASVHETTPPGTGGRAASDAHVPMQRDAGTAHDAGTHAPGSGGAPAQHDAAVGDASAEMDAAVEHSGETRPVIVAAGANHTLYLSVDGGMTFCQVRREVPANVGDGYDNLFRHVSYANGYFVAGSGAVVLASRNGWDWQDVTDGDRPKLGGWVAEIDYGNGYWVGVGANGYVMRSSDLARWEKLSVGWGSQHARSMAFGDGKFVASRDNSGWWSSTDGSRWTQYDAGQKKGVVFDGGEFIPDPGYRHGDGVRLRSTNKQIQRAEDRDGAPYTTVATLQDMIADFAFGEAPVEDYAAGEVTPPALADCLGL